MKIRNSHASLIAGCALLIAAGTFYAQNVESEHERDLAPTGRGIGTEYAPGQQSGRFGARRAGRPAPASGNGIQYHGGPLMGTTGSPTPNVYVIWYGNWTGNTATTLLPNLLSHIGGSPYFRINTTYKDGSNRSFVNAVNYKGSTTDNYSQGKSLTDASVQAIVTTAISGAKLPNDTAGVYFVLTSADVNETSGFCTNYCGWHTNGTINGTDIKYSFVGNGDRCPSSCEEQSTSPNGNAGADGMASVIAHELEETVTDPDLNAWYDRRGYENADKCAWTFGTTSTAGNGSMYNMTLNGTKYLIQRNWVNASGGYCALSY